MYEKVPLARGVRRVKVTKLRAPDKYLSTFLDNISELEPSRGMVQRWHPPASVPRAPLLAPRRRMPAQKPAFELKLQNKQTGLFLGKTASVSVHYLCSPLRVACYHPRDPGTPGPHLQSQTIRGVPWAAAAETKAPSDVRECYPMRTTDAVELVENGKMVPTKCIYFKSKLKKEPTGFNKIQTDACPRSRSAGAALCQKVQNFSNSASEHAVGHLVCAPALPQLITTLLALWTQALLVFKARCLEACPQVQELEAGAPDMGPKPFTPQGEPLGTEFPPRVGFHARGSVSGRTVSQPVLSFASLQT